MEPMAKAGGEKKPGARGGVKHTPGRGHDSKSAAHKKARYARKASRKRKQQEEQGRRLWEAYDRLSDEQKRLLGPVARPKPPRGGS